MLVTGAAGFVGSHLCDRLLAEGWEVVGLDNFLTGHRRNLEHLTDEPRFRFIEGDVCDPPELDGPLDWILHFASPASPPRYQDCPIHCLRTNAEGTHLLLEQARRLGAKFFFASTSEVYGDPEVHPQVEDYRGNVSCVGPRSMYDEAKRYGEAMVMAHHHEHGTDTRIIRIFNTYGPRMAPDDGRVVSNFVCQALEGLALTVYGDGAQTRSFQYVDDLVEGIWRLMGVDFHEPVNLGNPQELTILELARTIQELLPAGATEVRFEPLPADDPTRRKPDITRAAELLGWEPKTRLREGLSRTIPYFAELLGADLDAHQRVARSGREAMAAGAAVAK